MEGQSRTMPSWLDLVAFDTEVAQDAKPEDVVFVDVGGGNGSQCTTLRQRFPNIRGRIVLQDRPAMLESSLDVAGVETIAHDFLAEQPVKHARAYYFGQILRKHDDDTCIQILQMHLPALYNSPLSRLYIDEKVLPNDAADASSPGAGATTEHSEALGRAHERKEGKWRWLLDQAGLEIVEIRKFTEFGDSVIIAKRRYQDQWR